MSITFNPVGIYDREVSLNLSNSNALELLRRLGLEDDYSGRVAPADLLAATARLRTKAELATVGAPALDRYADNGAATIEFGRVIDCGRPEGYFRERCDHLARIAVAAEAADVDVQWA